MIEYQVLRMHLYSTVELRDEPSKVMQNVVLNIKLSVIFIVEYAGGLRIIALRG